MCAHTHCPGWLKVIDAPSDYVQLRNFLFEFEVSNPLVVLLLLHCSSVCSDALSWMYENEFWFVDLSPLQQCVFIRTVLDEGRSSVVQATMSNLETFPE